MRYSIFDFNQQKLLEIENLDLTDLLLLQYIKDAIASPSMEHKLDDDGNMYYVWLNHDKILNDLPFLNIKKDRLNQRLSNLCKKGLLQSIQVCNSNKRGSKSFYALTQKTVDLTYNDEDERPAGKDYSRNNDRLEKITAESERPAGKDYRSDSQLKKTDKELDIDNNKNTNFSFGNRKPKKPNLYQQYINLINAKTDDKEIRSLLVEWLNMLIEIFKSKNKVLYAGALKGKLKMLDDYNPSEWKEVINYNIQKGYQGFYPINKGNEYKKTSGYVDDIPEGINGTHEHYEGDHSLSGLYF